MTETSSIGNIPEVFSPRSTEDKDKASPCTAAKVALIVGGMLVIIGAALAAWLHHSSLGNFSFIYLAAEPVGIVLIVMGIKPPNCLSTPSGSSQEPRQAIRSPSNIAQPFPQGETPSCPTFGERCNINFAGLNAGIYKIQGYGQQGEAIVLIDMAQKPKWGTPQSKIVYFDQEDGVFYLMPQFDGNPRWVSLAYTPQGYNLTFFFDDHASLYYQLDEDNCTEDQWGQKFIKARALPG